MCKKIKKIFRKTLIGVIAMLFVLFFSVPWALAVNQIESIEGKFEIHSDQYSNPIFIYAPKYVGQTNAVIRAAKIESGKVYYATDLKVGGSTKNIDAQATTKVESLKFSPTNFAIIAISPGAVADKKVVALSQCEPNWNENPDQSSLTCDTETEIFTSPGLTMDSFDGAYNGGNNYYVVGPGTDGVLTLWIVDSTNGTVNAYPVMYEISSNNWASLNASHASADGINDSEIAVAMRHPTNGYALGVAKVCVVEDCIDGVSPDYGYITSVNDGLRKPVTIATPASNPKLEIKSAGSDVDQTIVLYNDNQNKFWAARTDFSNTPGSGDKSQLSQPDQIITMFNTTKPVQVSENGENYYKAAVVYTDGTVTNYTTITLTGDSISHVGIKTMETATIKSIGAGLTSPTEGKTYLASGSTQTLKAGSLTLGGEIGPLQTLENFGGGGAAIPEFPTKWVAVLVGAVALIAAVALASWRKKKEAK